MEGGTMLERPDGVRVIVSSLADDPVSGVRDHLELVPQSAPNTAELSQSDVLIGVRSTAIAWVDLLMTSGQYQHQPPLPYSPGLEYSGDVLTAVFQPR